METEKLLVKNHVLHLQDGVIDALIGCNEIENAYETEKWYDVLEWWLITPYLAKHLIGESEIVIDSLGCHWWGRRVSGRAIHMDMIISKICNS